MAVVIPAAAIRVAFTPSPSPVILGACAGALVLDFVFARYLLRTGRVSFVVTRTTSPSPRAGYRRQATTADHPARRR